MFGGFPKSSGDGDPHRFCSDASEAGAVGSRFAAHAEQQPVTGMEGSKIIDCIYGCLWICVDFCGILSISLDLGWISMDLGWISMDLGWILDNMEHQTWLTLWIIYNCSLTFRMDNDGKKVRK